MDFPRFGLMGLVHLQHRRNVQLCCMLCTFHAIAIGDALIPTLTYTSGPVR